MTKLTENSVVAVRPAVAMLAHEENPRGVRRVYAKSALDYRYAEHWEATLLDGFPDQIAARVQHAAYDACYSELHDPSYNGKRDAECRRCRATIARVLATLGITTEARDA